MMIGMIAMIAVMISQGMNKYLLFHLNFLENLNENNHRKTKAIYFKEKYERNYCNKFEIILIGY